MAGPSGARGSARVAISGVRITAAGNSRKERGLGGLLADGGGGGRLSPRPSVHVQPRVELPPSGEGGVWEGILPGARNGRPASVCRPAHLEAGMRWGKTGGLEFCSLGPRLWLPGSGVLGSPPPCPILFPERRPSFFLLPGPPSHPSLPCTTLLPSGHASSASPSPLAKNTVLLNSDL